MRSVFVIFLVTIAVIHSEDTNDCDQHSYYVCNVDDVPEEFPGTQEELYRMCKTEIRFFKCVIRNEEKCQGDAEFIQHHKDLLASTKQLCKKDSPTHSVVVDSLDCVKPIFEDNSFECHSLYPGSTSMKKHAQALRRKGIPLFSRNKEDRKECLRRLFILACEALKIEEKCGTSAMEAFIGVVYSRSIPQTEVCNKRIKNFPLEIIRIIKEGELETLRTTQFEEDE